MCSSKKVLYALQVMSKAIVSAYLCCSLISSITYCASALLFLILNQFWNIDYRFSWGQDTGFGLWKNICHKRCLFWIATADMVYACNPTTSTAGAHWHVALKPKPLTVPSLCASPAKPADGDPRSGARGGPGQVRRRRVPPRRPPSREGEEENLGQAVGGSSGR